MTTIQRILVTNDDGIYAPGIKVLEKIARKLSDDVWVVAPEINHSGAGHSLTLRRPLRIRHISEHRYAVDGTPTDCVLLALQTIIKDAPVSLVLSGVNHGGNLGEDVTYSGTIAAAMEATLFNVPAIAMSQVCMNAHPVKWATTETFAPELIKKLVATGWPENVLINVNFPDRVAASVEGVRVARQGKRKIGDELVERIDPRGEPYVWIGAIRTHETVEEGTDLAAVQNGYIAVTPVNMDMTDRASFATLRSTVE